MQRLRLSKRGGDTEENIYKVLQKIAVFEMGPCLLTGDQSDRSQIRSQLRGQQLVHHIQRHHIPVF